MQQTMKMPSSGSFFNYLMSNNASIPAAGEWATIMHYTDRTVAKVVEVSEDGKTVILEDCDTVAAKPNSQMGHQDWVHYPNGYRYTIRYIWGGWHRVGKTIVFTEEFKASLPIDSAAAYLKKNNPELFKEIYDEDYMPCKVVAGITKEKKVYEKVRVLFGEANYYYDWSF